jgi:hypothetical protein
VFDIKVVVVVVKLMTVFDIKFVVKFMTLFDIKFVVVN